MPVSMIRSNSNTPWGYQRYQSMDETNNLCNIDRFEVRAADSHQSEPLCADKICERQRGILELSCRERSELSERDKETSGDGSFSKYEWDLFLDHREFPNLFPVKTVLGQFFQHKFADGGNFPLFLIQHDAEGLYLDVQGPNGTNKTRCRRLISENELFGRWHRFNIEAYWSIRKDGYFKISINDQEKTDQAHVNVQTLWGSKAFFKYGIYRSFTCRANKPEIHSQIAYYRNVRLGTKISADAEYEMEEVCLG